jgi:hypothetical protein
MLASPPSIVRDHPARPPDDRHQRLNVVRLQAGIGGEVDDSPWPASRRCSSPRRTSTASPLDSSRSNCGALAWAIEQLRAGRRQHGLADSDPHALQPARARLAATPIVR